MAEHELKSSLIALCTFPLFVTLKRKVWARTSSGSKHIQIQTFFLGGWEYKPIVWSIRMLQKKKKKKSSNYRCVGKERMKSKQEI